MCDKDVLQNQNIKTKQISISSLLSSLQPNFLNFSTVYSRDSLEFTFSHNMVWCCMNSCRFRTNKSDLRVKLRVEIIQKTGTSYLSKILAMTPYLP